MIGSPFTLRAVCLAAMLALAPLGVAAQDSRLTVTGAGSASAVPDMATVQLGVTAQDAQAGAAMDAASRVAAEILSRLDGLNIAPRDRQTSDIGLQPVWSGYDSDDRRITGYQASNSLTVRVRDLDSLGDVLAAVTEGGANRLAGLGFGLQEPGPVMDAARRDAVADALARANVLAEAAGETLGPILSITEGNSSAPMPMPMMEMARVSSAPVAAGEQTMSAQVTIVFALGDAAQ